MKKALIITGSVILALLVLLLIAPFLFKDKIKARVDEELAKSLNAKTYYDANSFSLSFFRSFPSLSVSLERFGVVGVDAFAGDTLMSVGKFAATVDVMSVISGDKIVIRGVDLERPRIQALRLADGRANWDIVKGDSAVVDTATNEPSKFSIQVEGWKITDGQVTYIDGQLPMVAIIQKMNHSGSGDFNQDILTLSTKTDLEGLSVEYDSVSYLSNKRFRADVDMEINQPESKYTFSKNEIRINELGLALEGWVKLAGEAIDSDVKFKSLNGNFRDLLSIVPGVYTKSFEGLKAEGNFDLTGMAKGRYEGDNLPQMKLALKVTDGQFQYPDLPSAVTGVQLDLGIDHSQGILDKIAVNLRQLSMKVGKNPVQAKATVQGLENMIVDAQVNAKLNLAEISQAFPMDGLSLKGLMNLDVTAKGVYNDARKRLPAVNAQINLLDGYVKSKDFPAPIEQLTMQAFVNNGTGRMEDTKIRIPALSLMLEGEPFQMSGVIEDLVNYRWDIAVKGVLDLTKITKIYPIEGTTLAGKVRADITTRGAMVDVGAGRYDKLPTAGTLAMEGVQYKSADLPQGATVTKASFKFNPAAVDMMGFAGSLGQSPIEMNGTLNNYMAYFLKGQTLRGNLNFSSSKFNVNEWMTDEPEAKPAQPEEPMSAVEVPRNLDLNLNATIAELIYTNLVMKDVRGNVVVKDGMVRLDHLKTNTLGGSIELAGMYDSRNLARPAYDMNLQLAGVSIPETYTAFAAVQALAPIAKRLTGNMDGRFSLSGLMSDKMSPLLPTLQGSGMVALKDATVGDVKMLSGLNSIAKLNLPTQASLKDVKLVGKIVNGMLNFEPFNFQAGGQKFTINGANGFDQSINYNLKTQLPASAVSGLQGAAGLANLPGGNQPIDLNFKVTGTHDSPKIALGSVGKGAAANVKQAVTERVKDEADKLKKEAEDRARQEADRLKKEAEDRARQEGDRLKKEAEDRAKKQLEELKKKAPKIPGL